MKLGPYELNSIITGDARELSKAIPDNSVDLIFTDPVYDQIEDYEWLAKTAARVLKDDRACLVWCGIGYLDHAFKALTKSLAYRWQGIWYQSNNMQRADMGYCKYSTFLWAEKGSSSTYKPLQDLRNNPVSIGNNRQDKFHQWTKRTEIIEYYLDGFSLFDSIIFDPFTGGGTVPAVCKQLNRQYLAFEIDPATADLARQRVANTQPPLPIVYPEQMELSYDHP